MEKNPFVSHQFTKDEWNVQQIHALRGVNSGKTVSRFWKHIVATNFWEIRQWVKKLWVLRRLKVN